MHILHRKLRCDAAYFKPCDEQLAQLAWVQYGGGLAEGM
jgi:hypothetical protein